MARIVFRRGVYVLQIDECKEQKAANALYLPFNTKMGGREIYEIEYTTEAEAKESLKRIRRWVRKEKARKIIESNLRNMIRRKRVRRE